MNNHIKRKFMKSIRKTCTFPKEYKKRFIRDVEHDLDLFFTDRPNIAYREFLEEFGEPEEIIANYCLMLPPEVLRAQLHPHLGPWAFACTGLAVLLIGGFAYLIRPMDRLNDQTMKIAVSANTVNADSGNSNSTVSDTNTAGRSPSEIAATELFGTFDKNLTLYNEAGGIAICMDVSSSSDELSLNGISVHTVPDYADADTDQADPNPADLSGKSVSDQSLEEFLGEDFFLHNASYYDADGNKIMTVKNLSQKASAEEAIVTLY